MLSSCGAVAGDEAGSWQGWYKENIPVVEAVTTVGSRVDMTRRSEISRNWKDVREDALRAGLDEQAVENARKEMLDEVRAYRLADIRNEQHLSQSDVALRMKVSQPRVSAIERGELGSTELGTLEAYVGALGGKVRIVAQFGDDALTIGG